MNALSLFDGMSCGMLALLKAGKTVNGYWAAEIDKYAQFVSNANFPNINRLGDVRFVTYKDGILKSPFGEWKVKLDALIGGSPCQSFSFAGKRKGMSTKDEIEILTLGQYLKLKEDGFEFEGQSYLFWEYMRLLTEIRAYNPDVKFLLENVMMGSKWQRILTRAIGINPICINSALVSAQNRERLYWTNIGAEPAGFFGDLVCTIQQPKDKGILLGDILEPEVDDKYFLNEKAIKSLREWEERNKKNGNGFKMEIRAEDEKSSALSTGSQKSSSTLIVHNMQPRSGDPTKGGTGHLTRADGKTYCLDTGSTNAIEIKSGILRTHNDGKGFREVVTGKGATIPARAREDGSGQNVVSINGAIRRLTPTECERLQTVPDNYTNHVSDTQRYKMLGNGWTVDVIAHIFSYL